MTHSVGSFDLAGYYCPIAKVVMAEPVKLPCCQGTIDQTSLKALLARLPRPSGTLSCPLCKFEMVFEGEADPQTGELIRRIKGVVLNSPLRTQIELWIAEDPASRRSLVIDPRFFEEPASHGVHPFSSSTKAPGLIESLSAASSDIPLSFGPKFTAKAEEDDPIGERRSFLAVFNMIWQEIPYVQRGTLFSASTQKDLADAAEGWLASEGSTQALSTIKALHLQGLGLEILPDVVKRLPRLTYLDISKNRLRELPVIHSLRGLDARENCIQEVNDTISGMKFLNYLLLADNPLKSMSLKAAELEELHHLDLEKVDSNFLGLSIEFISFRICISLDKEQHKQWISTVVAEGERLFKIAEFLRAKQFENANESFKTLSKCLQKQVEQSMSDIALNSSRDVFTGTIPKSISSIHIVAMYIIIWLYWKKSDQDAKKLFLKLPEKFRNQIYGLVYQELQNKWPEKKVSNPKIGETEFLGNTLEYQVRIKVMITALRQELKKIDVSQATSI